MAQREMTIHDVAALSKAWEQPSIVASELIAKYDVAEAYAEAEGLIHEICHAAVFRMQRIGRNIGDRIGVRFIQYTANANKPLKRSKRYSDRSECAALATEMVVFELLGWADQIPFDVLVQMAVDDLMVMPYEEADTCIGEYLTKDVTTRRAIWVVEWLRMRTRRDRRHNQMYASKGTTL